MLKIRNEKSMTYVCNDEAKTSGRQVPMDKPALCRLEDIPDGGAIAADAVVDGEEENLILLRQGGSVRAYLNICPHAGRQLDWAPGKFLVKDGTLVCAVHGASFAVASGLCGAGPCRGQSLTAVAVGVIDGTVSLGA
jgi:nitrite reductase/ring-hydroxylating ferredoxin subunit